MPIAESSITRIVLKLVLPCAVAAALAVAAWLLDRHSLSLELSTYLYSYGFYANAVPVALAFALLFCATNRIALSTLLILSFLFAIFFINGMKVRVLLQPINLSDLYFLRGVNASTLHLLRNYITPGSIVVVALVLSIAIVVAIIEPPYFNGLILTRAVAFAAAAAISIGLLRGAAWSASVYAPEKLGRVPWSPGETELHAGLFSSLIYEAISSSNALSQPVDRANIDRFLRINTSPRSVLAEKEAVHELPDIVIVQSESFFDPVILNGIEETHSLLPNLYRAQTLGYKGSMRVPTFGGGTLRTEFEVLTGIPMAAIPQLKFPYLQIHSETLPSIINTVHAHGYQAYAIHPNAPSFWNRANAFSAMGFDAFYSRRDFPAKVEKDGLYISDEAMTSKIIGVLESSSTPTLIMAISIEAHGPYQSDTVPSRAKELEIAVPASWPRKAKNEYKSYAYHIHHADRELGRLWDYLDRRDRPFVLMFYGDHLPGMPEVYAASGGFKDQVGAQDQPVPWVLISNQKVAGKRPMNISSWMAGGQLLCAAGIRPKAYYALLNRAAILLSDPGVLPDEGDVLNGANALAILRLQGKPFRQSTTNAAAQSNCFYSGSRTQ